MHGGARTAMGLVLAEKILLNMEKGELNWTVFFDQSKALDTVNQLLMKLSDLTDALLLIWCVTRHVWGASA